MQVGPVTIERGVDPSSRYWIERPNQVTKTTSDGSILCYDLSYSIIRGVLQWRYLTAAKKAELENFVANTIRFGRFRFDIIPDAWVNLGLGDGVALVGVSLDLESPSTESIFSPSGRGAYFDCAIPYRYKIPPSGATVDNQGVAG